MEAQTTSDVGTDAEASVAEDALQALGQMQSVTARIRAGVATLHDRDESL